MTTTPIPAMTVEPVAAERTEILRLAHTPHLTNSHGGLTIAPYSVWITYRREADQPDHTWHAAVSGYRVLPNGVTDMDAQSITLRSDDDVPQWLADLVSSYTPSNWKRTDV